MENGDQAMNELHEKLANSIKCGASIDQMLELVLQYKNHGVGQREIYDVLEGIWQETGCDKAGEDHVPVCDVLGELMDRVWGYCRSKDAIWDTSLSGKKIK